MTPVPGERNTGTASTEGRYRLHETTVPTKCSTQCITFWVTEEQKQEISAYAAEHNMTVSRLIIESLELRMACD